MRRNLHPRELGDLLDRPLNAVLGLHRQSGSILLTPVWHLFKDGSFYIQVPGGDRKIAMLRREQSMADLASAHMTVPHDREIPDSFDGIPKVELHCHVEGTVRPTTVIELAAKAGRPLPVADPAELYRYESLDSRGRRRRAPRMRGSSRPGSTKPNRRSLAAEFEEALHSVMTP